MAIAALSLANTDFLRDRERIDLLARPSSAPLYAKHAFSDSDDPPKLHDEFKALGSDTLMTTTSNVRFKSSTSSKGLNLMSVPRLGYFGMSEGSINLVTRSNWQLTTTVYNKCSDTNIIRVIGSEVAKVSREMLYAVFEPCALDPAFAYSTRQVLNLKKFIQNGQQSWVFVINMLRNISPVLYISIPKRQSCFFQCHGVARVFVDFDPCSILLVEDSRGAQPKLRCAATEKRTRLEPCG